MRIALFLPSLSGGGAERAFVNLTYGLVQRGVEVDMVLRRAEGPFLSKLPKQVQVFELSFGRKPSNISLWARLRRFLQRRHTISPNLNLAIKTYLIALKLAHYWRSKQLQGCLSFQLDAMKFGDYLQKRRPNAILSGLTPCNLIALLSRRFASYTCQLVINEHNTPSINWSHLSKGVLMWRMARSLYPEADGIVCVSQGVAEDLCRLVNLQPHQVHVIYNPVVVPELFQKAQEPVNHHWFEDGQTHVILAVGRLVEQKDYPNLLRAFSLVRQNRAARLVILGEGEERPKLEQLAKELKIQNDISMPGFVENPFAFMAKASVFVLSSAWEGLPTVVIEALACGCPVVATDCRSGPKEILDNGRYGRLVPVGDHEALAKAILETLDNPDYPADKGARIQRALDFSVDAAVDKYLKVLLGS